MIETVEFLTRLGDDHWLLKIKLTFFFFLGIILTQN